MSSNPYAPPEAPVVAPALLESTPALWNPNAAASWSLLLTPIFGALLHMKNWRALGEPERAATSRNWALLGVTFLALSMVGTLVLPESRSLDSLGRAFGLALLLSWYFGSAKGQVAYVEKRFGKSYRRRPWAMPLLLGLAGLIGLFVLVFILGAVSAFIRLGPPM